MDVAALVVSLLAALSPYVLELRGRTRASPSQIETLESALLELEAALASWIIAAAETNRAAREWAGELPDSAWRSWGDFFDSWESQTAYVGYVDSAFRSRAGIPGGPGRIGRKRPRADLKDIFRVHCPGAEQVFAALEERKGRFSELHPTCRRSTVKRGRKALRTTFRPWSVRSTR